MFIQVVVGMATLGTLATGGVDMASVAPPDAPLAVVPVTILDGQGTPGGARPTVEVRVGSARAAVPVLLDTGSSGLHIFKTAVATGPGSGVTLTSQPANITYAGGDRFTGVVGRAVVTIGSYATRTPVAFSYVERAFCVARKPTCPASGGISGYEQSGMYGILGIGTQTSQGGIASPILGMPGRLRATWSIHLHDLRGALTLGAPVPAPRSATTIQMNEIGSSAGSTLWADSRLPLCVSVGPVNECVRGLFDSGTYTMQISGPQLGRAPTAPGTDHVASGAPVAVAVKRAAAPFWRFAAGPTKSQDLVTVKAGQGPFVNTGVQAFYDFTITYDDITGQVRLAR